MYLLGYKYMHTYMRANLVASGTHSFLVVNKGKSIRMSPLS